jgi:outer membrane protein assembly factor BamB
MAPITPMNNHFRSWQSTGLICAAALLTTLVANDSLRAENWARFRGENGLGLSSERGFPTQWSPGDYRWEIALPGVGHAAPIIWGDRLFVTSAEDEGALRFLFCLDPRSGEQLWSRVVGMNRSHKHLKGSWASSTPCTDGKQVYVAFADEERYTLAAYDFEGELVWRRSLGAFQSQHGQGASPIVYDGVVILANDQDGPSSVMAFDAATGNTVWSVLRPADVTSYATPLVLELPGDEPQLICSNVVQGVASLEPKTGRVNWQSGKLPARPVGSPVFADGLIVQACGTGGVGKALVAVDPSQPENAAMARTRYTLDREVPYVPTPIAYKEHIYLLGDNGVAHCLTAATGEKVWTKRLGGKYSGSAVCIDGTLYFLSEEGEVVILAASPDYHLYGKVPLGDPSHSTPAVANGSLYFRTFHRLYCLPALRERSG